MEDGAFGASRSQRQFRAARHADADRDGSCRATNGAKHRRGGTGSMLASKQRRITAFYRPEKHRATHRALCVRSPFGQRPRSPKRRAFSRHARSLVHHVGLAPLQKLQHNQHYAAPANSSDGQPFPGNIRRMAHRSLSSDAPRTGMAGGVTISAEAASIETPAETGATPYQARTAALQSWQTVRRKSVPET